MPNFRTHAIVGIGVGIGLNLIKQSTQRALDPDRDFDWAEMLAWGGAGLLVASTPDLLEPALHPGHRGTCHSLAAAGLILWIMKGNHTVRWSRDGQDMANLVGWSYLSHLALDFLTKRGLPFV